MASKQPLAPIIFIISYTLPFGKSFLQSIWGFDNILHYAFCIVHSCTQDDPRGRLAIFLDNLARA